MQAGGATSTARAGRRLGSRGWSLLEVVTALGMAAVLGSTAVLAHQSARPMVDLMLATRQVGMDLRLARMRAIGENSGGRLVFLTGSVTYQVQRQVGTAYVDVGAPVPLPRGIRIADCTAANDAISFRPRGNAGSFGTVTLTNAKGDSRFVIVNIAGRVREQ